jgi:hypothetical protein
MPYDKPKITIDFEEYQELKNLETSIVGDEYVNMAKEVVAAFMRNNLNLERANLELEKKGIIFGMSVNHSRGTYGIEAKDIYIVKKKETTV